MGLPELEAKLVRLIDIDVHQRTGQPDYHCSKALRDSLTEIMVEVFLAGAQAGPIPGMGDQSYAAQIGQEPQEDQ